MSTTISLFKTPELESQFLAAYEAALDLWPVPSEALDVPTRFGSTHVNACGLKEKPAMVLLSGFGANSTMWYPNVAALSSQFRLYALDTIGQPGKSIPSRQIDAQNSQVWIQDVLDGLSIQRARLVGISLGGWLSLNFALHTPERVERLVLLDPASSFEKVSPSFFWHSLIPIMIHPTRPGLIRYFKWMTRGYAVNSCWGELMLQGILNARPQPPIRPKVFSDEALRQVETPTLLLIGGRSVIYDPERAYRRATRLMPNLEAEFIPNASHALNDEKSEIVNARILQFCQMTTTRGRNHDVSN
jgi:pimeloyl-ACP methyl ester carboxylesterase